MNIIRNFIQEAPSVEVKVDKMEIEITKLADAIGKAVARELAPLLNNLSVSGHTGYNPSGVDIDERLHDVGISTEGLKLGTDKPLASETTKEDNVSGTRSKLQKLKRK